jgi:ubiquinone/menaquinone biosynthesis C-methylase UbiE
MSDAWRTWNNDKRYGEVLFKRATGEFPEMESSKALARLIKTLLKPGNSVLDVGCGAGHYLRSLRREIGRNFTYTGVDATEHYLELARKAFPGEKDVTFTRGDIYQLPFPAGSFDIVTCNNLLLHLPSIEKPVSELIRVARSSIVIRSLIGDRSFRIQDLEILGDEFDSEGNPKQFHFYNIYSRDYFTHLLKGFPRVRSTRFVEDWEYEPAAIERSATENEGKLDASHMLGKWQRNGYILQPWAFVIVELSNAC